MNKRQFNRNLLHPRRLVLLAGILVIIVGMSLFLWQQYDGSKVTEELKTLAETEDGRFRLIEKTVVKKKEESQRLYIEDETGAVRDVDWSIKDDRSAFAPSLQLADINNDKVEELVIVLKQPNSSGETTEELHVLQTADLAELQVPSVGEFLEQSIETQLVKLDKYVWVRLAINGQIYEKALDEKVLPDWGDKIDIVHAVSYIVQPDYTYAMVDVAAGAGKETIKLGKLEVDLGLYGNGAKMNIVNFHVAEEIAGEIPLYAIRVEGKYIGLQDVVKDTELVELLGKPLAESSQPFVSDPDDSITKKQTYQGIELGVFTGKDSEDRYVFNIRLTDDQFATSLGLRVGDTVEKVKAMYPLIDLVKDGRTPSQDFACEINSGRTNLRIEIKNGVVNEIIFSSWLDG